MKESVLNKIVVLATGGTIAGVGTPGKKTGYKSGQVLAADLVAAIPEIQELAEVQVEQICNINSDDVTASIWLELARRIDVLMKDSSVERIVITHGTDTMEETAFFLDLVLEPSKPVILTGSMLPSTMTNPDGPGNLLNAIKMPCGPGVMVAFGDELYKASRVQKCHVNDLLPFKEVGEFEVKHRFPLNKLDSLPQVNALYFHSEADAALVEFAASRSKGLVIAGAGAGEFSESWKMALSKVQIPVVVCTRINQGSVTPDQLLVPGTIAGGNLPPSKAAVLLRLALTETSDCSEIQKMFC